MSKVSDVLNFLTEFAPIEKALDFDNVGLLLGKSNKICNRIILTLDISSDVIAEAADKKADLIISHHPLIFNPIKRFTYDEPESKNIIDLIKNEISVISMHTNLDAAEEGVNKTLAHKLGMNPEVPLNIETNIGIVGSYPKCRLEDFLKKVRIQLGCEALRYHKSQEYVERLAICGGAGGDELLLAKNLDCDTYLTSEIKHHVWIKAKELKINLIDAGHFETENPVTFVLEKKLKEEFSDIDIFVAHSNVSPYLYFIK
ncbi:MAG: Nif3-like dinuclear metal center hexameric protein [Candidatus Scatomorpha sp.]|jgi:dinuclear metal center YbgI/SA1388 family protein